MVCIKFGDLTSVAEAVLASQEGLCSVQLLGVKVAHAHNLQ